MMKTERQDSTVSDSEEESPSVRVGIKPLFSTWVYLCDDGPTHLNLDLEQLAYDLMKDDCNAITRTNAGGWHYAFDFFNLDAPVVSEFRECMEQHVQAFLNYFRSEDKQKQDVFKLRGWINVNRAGNSNTLHSHP